MTQLRCPTCDVPIDPQRTTAMPFCSPRCKQIDLGRWLKEEYGMAVEPEDMVGRRAELPDEDEQVAD